MDFETILLDNAVEFRLKGRIAGDEIRSLEEALLGPEVSGRSEVVLEMNGVRFLDSIAIGRLVSLGNDLKKAGKHFVFTHPSREFGELFHDLALDRLFEMRD